MEEVTFKLGLVGQIIKIQFSGLHLKEKEETIKGKMGRFDY